MAHCRGVQIGCGHVLHLVLAISARLSACNLAHLVASDVEDPLSSLMAFLIRTVAGGVLMMKVKPCLQMQ